jgi:hypothetical protein
MIRAAGCQVVNDSAAANLLKIERVQKWTGKISLPTTPDNQSLKI